MFVVLIQSTECDLLDVLSPQHESKEPMGSGDSWSSCLLPEEGVDTDCEFDD